MFEKTAGECGRPFPLVNDAVKGYLKREPRVLLDTETGAGTARFAPPCTATKRELHFTTSAHRSGPRSTAIWRQTPAAGQGPRQQAGRKYVSAWRHPPFSVCAVPTLRPEGSRARSLYPDFPYSTTLFRAGARLSGTVCACGGEGAGLQGRVLARRGRGTRDRPWTHYRKLAKPRDAKSQSRLDRN